MNHRTLLLAITVALASSSPARSEVAVAPSEIVGAKRALHEAVAHGTVQDILTVRARFAALAARSPKSASLHYWVAVSDWRATPRLSGTKKEEAERLCKDGLAEIDRALTLAPKDAEALALKANLLGMSLQFNPGAMMTIGPEIESDMRSALKAAPANPRVQLLAGLNTLNKPAFVGGGAKPALEQFAESQRLFETAASADSLAPDWGRDDAYIWAGRAAMKLGDPTAAAGHYRQALQVTPDHAWVAHQLLPEAEKAAAAKTAAR